MTRTENLSSKATYHSKVIPSTFNGAPCFGGVFYESSRTYVKKLKLSAYYWPKRSFPIDAPVLDQLKRLGCETLVLHVADTGDHYSIDMDTFLENAQAIDWREKDSRFPMRFYCPLDLWHKVGEEAA